MNLIKEVWTEKDIPYFLKYLEQQKNIEKVEWTRRILNTNMPVLAIKTPILRKIASEIKKGNYISFLDLNINKYYENTVINGALISSIKDFELMNKYLDNYVMHIDNWSSCDLLKFNIKKNEEKFYKLSMKYIKSNYPFVRRVGIYILFNFIDNDNYYSKIYGIIDKLKDEEEYYVNMINAWLLCELFIKRRNTTIKYLTNNNLNKFTINKAISKCRDSFRVTKEDKELLLKFKK